MIRRVVCGGAVGIVIAVWLLSTAVVNAHAELRTAEPAPGDQLAETPAQIKLIFNEPLGAGSTFTLFDEGFGQIKVLVTHDQDVSTTLLANNVPSLSNGIYTVQWLAVSEDGHPLMGSYEFSIGDHMLTSTMAEITAYNPPDILAWIMVILALALPTAVYFWQKNQRP